MRTSIRANTRKGVRFDIVLHVLNTHSLALGLVRVLVLAVGRIVVLVLVLPDVAWMHQLINMSNPSH